MRFHIKLQAQKSIRLTSVLYVLKIRFLDRFRVNCNGIVTVLIIHSRLFKSNRLNIKNLNFLIFILLPQGPTSHGHSSNKKTMEGLETKASSKDNQQAYRDSS